MQKIIPEFKDTLGRQNRLLESLIDLGEEKRRVIVLGDVEQLDKLMQKEGIIVSNLEKLEGARFQLQRDLARKWDMPAEQATAAVIITRVKQDCPEYFKDMDMEIKRLRQATARLREINNENNDLINISLNYVNEMQALFSGEVAGTYSREGQQVDESVSRPNLRMLDRKA